MSLVFSIFFLPLGDGSCFVVQQDLDYVIELTGADCDPVYKVQVWLQTGLGESHLGSGALGGTESSYFVIIWVIKYLGMR